MKKKIAILGSTGSIGTTLLNIINLKKNNFEIILLTAHKNYKKLLRLAKKFDVKNLIITDKTTYDYVSKYINKNKYNLYNDFKCFRSIFKNKIDYTMSSIVGLEGLNPTLNIIKYTKVIAIANKETIICGWKLLKKELKKNNTQFIPVDSEHFSIWSAINFSPFKVEKIYLTASGGPFHRYNFHKLKNVGLKKALKHPTWKMGKKISIDSATMMNKVFEIIEAKKIFNVSYKKLEILIHPISYIHAIVKFSNGIFSLIGHETTMKIPIFNSLYFNDNNFLPTPNINLKKLNSVNLSATSVSFFPSIELIKLMPLKDSLFETVIVSANDYLVELFLNKKINFKQISTILLKSIKMKNLSKYKKISPESISDIVKAKSITIDTIKKNIINYNVKKK